MASKLALAVMRSHFIFKCILLFNMVPPVVSMPGHYDYDRLPPMHDGQDNKLIWDGIPSPILVHTFWRAFISHYRMLWAVLPRTATLYWSQHLTMMLVALDLWQFQTTLLLHHKLDRNTTIVCDDYLAVL